MSKRTINALWAEYEPLRVAPLKTAKEQRRVFNNVILPRYGHRQADKIIMQELETWKLQSIEIPYQFNRALNYLSSMMRYAEAIKWLAPGSNPCTHVPRFPEKKRRRHMKEWEAPVIYRLLNFFEKQYPRQVLLIWLLVFTGARPSELMAARWGQLKDNVLTLDAHKTEDDTGTPRIIVLPPLAVEKFSLVGGRGHPDSPIIGQINYNYFWKIFRSEGKLENLRVYDMRHTFATYALANGYTLDQIGEALEHQSPQTTKIYAEMSLKNRQRLSFDASVAILRDMQVVEEDVPDVFL